MCYTPNIYIMTVLQAFVMIFGSKNKKEEIKKTKFNPSCYILP